MAPEPARRACPGYVGRVALEILVVEDDPVLRELLVLHLAAEGFSVREAGTGDEALAACTTKLPDVVVLDVSLPTLSGLEVCLALRASYRPTPGVVMVTARASEAEIMIGFDSGADDYVVKPCRPREIVARVRALARRVRPDVVDAEVLRRGELTVDLATLRATVGGAPLELTPTELSVLVELCRRPGTVHARKALLAKIWSSSHEGYARNVDCHVARLRRKLEKAGMPGAIETVHGAGYRFLDVGQT